MVKLYPSILAADFCNLGNDIRKVEKLVDGFHLDIMDGMFVPNISFGFPIVESMRKYTNADFDTHLMIVDPDRYIERFAYLSQMITVHYEAVTHLHRTVTKIKDFNCKAGVALNPHTPVSVLEEILPELDLVLIMSVNPGFTAQKFIEASVNKIQKLRKLADELNPNLRIMVDGGVGLKNIKQLTDAGAESYVVGAAVFHAEDPVTAVEELRKAAE